MAHFIPTTDKITAEGTAELFIQEIFRLHGLPLDIVSDRGPQFVSTFWKQIHTRLGISTSLSSAYHPESDGQTERTNATLEQYLRCYCDFNQENWVKLLPTAEFAYNNSIHAATKMTPFYACLGYRPRADFLADERNETITDLSNETANRFVTNLENIMTQLQFHLKNAQDTIKMYADQHRIDKHFNVGDMVLLSTRNLESDRPSRKLDYVSVGPYKIIEKINPVAYRLELPRTSRAHNVFHVWLLEPYYDPNPQTYVNETPTSSHLAPIPIVSNEKVFYKIDKILDSREDEDTWRYLIRWEGTTKEEDSWQPYEGCEESCFPEILDHHRRHPEKTMPPIVKKALQGRLIPDTASQSSDEDNDDENDENYQDQSVLKKGDNVTAHRAMPHSRYNLRTRA